MTGSTTMFSVLTAVHDPVPDHLRACLASVAGQNRAFGVEHVIVDDGSSDHAVVEMLDAAARHDGVELHRRSTNGGIVAASNDALDRATGAWVVLLDHDDELAAGALSVLAEHLGEHPDDEVVYSDHDLIRPDGRHAEPAYKPDFSPERLRQTNYITHLVAIRREVLVEIGGFRVGTDGAQDHDVLLRLAERGKPFGHVPAVLAHWRQSPRSVATDTGNKPTAFDAGRRVVADHVVRCGIDATVRAGPYPGTYRIDRHGDPERLISVVVPTVGSGGVVWGRRRTFVVEAIRSVVERSTHRALEFVVVAGEPTPDGALEELGSIVAAAEAITLRIVPFHEPFNFSRTVNAGVAAASGDLLLLLNDDTELIEPNGITTMAEHLTQPGVGRCAHGGVGAVGAKLLYADGTVQHGGHVYHGEFMHALLGWRGNHPGPQRMLAIERECSGVTAAAMMTSRRILDEVDGFPEDLPLHFNDVDVCVSIRTTGRRIIWTPNASWYHFEGRSRSRGASIDEWTRAASRWPDGVPTDPYANPNLAPKRADWLELPGRSGAPPYTVDDDGTVIWG